MNRRLRARMEEVDRRHKADMDALDRRHMAEMDAVKEELEKIDGMIQVVVDAGDCQAGSV